VQNDDELHTKSSQMIEVLGSVEWKKQLYMHNLRLGFLLSLPGMMSGMDSFLPGLGQDLSSSMEQSQVPPSVISLPLKFLSNGRPHQIESPKKKKRPGNKENSSESNKGAALISGGKYSFNGRPTAVFVVRSPATRK